MNHIGNSIAKVIYRPDADAERYIAEGAWCSEAAGDLLRSCARRYGANTALVSEDARITYAEWDRMSESLAGALLDLGLRPGDRALFQMGTEIDTAVALFGCFKSGIIPVCALPQHREIEIQALGERSGARAYFVQNQFGRSDLEAFAREMCARLPSIDVLIVSGTSRVSSGAFGFRTLIEQKDVARATDQLQSLKIGPHDVLSFQLSGGSTNVPKIIPRFHGEYLGQARDWGIRHEMFAGSTALYALPLIHNAGQIAMMFPIMFHGGKLVLMRRMETERFFELVERERVTHSLSIGPIAVQLLDYHDVSKYELSSLRCLMSFNGSERLERHLGVKCTNIFGITEGLLTSAGPAGDQEARFDTVGWPVSRFDEVRILVPRTEREVREGEIGELCFRGPSTLTGYFDMPDVNKESFTRDGFFRTGDLVRSRRPQMMRCYSFEGRIKDNIDRGGEKFGAEEVENAIARHPSILEAKVVAMADRVLGEKACACIILRQDAAPLSLDALADFLLGLGLAKYKLPERTEIMEAFPVTSVGKVDKQALRRLVAEKLSRETKPD